MVLLNLVIAWSGWELNPLIQSALTLSYGSTPGNHPCWWMPSRTWTARGSSPHCRLSAWGIVQSTVRVPEDAGNALDLHMATLAEMKSRIAYRANCWQRMYSSFAVSLLLSLTLSVSETSSEMSFLTRR